VNTIKANYRRKRRDLAEITKTEAKDVRECNLKLTLQSILNSRRQSCWPLSWDWISKIRIYPFWI